jgi:hypothetical protein
MRVVSSSYKGGKDAAQSRCGVFESPIAPAVAACLASITHPVGIGLIHDALRVTSTGGSLVSIEVFRESGERLGA